MRAMAKPFEVMHASLSLLRPSRVQPTPARIVFIATASQSRLPPALLLLLLLHTAINRWPAVIPLLPICDGHRPYTFLVVMLVVSALGLLTQASVAASKAGAQR